MFVLETVKLTGKNYMTFDEQLYRGKQHTFDRFNVSFVVTLTEHSLSYFFSIAQQPLFGQDLSLSKLQIYIQSDTPHSVGLVWTSDQPDAETST
jgi:hypothetical protein